MGVGEETSISSNPFYGQNLVIKKYLKCYGKSRGVAVSHLNMKKAIKFRKKVFSLVFIW